MHSVKHLIGVVMSTALLLLAVGCTTGGGERPTAARVVDDSVITGKVKTRLIEDQALKAFQINVETYRGDVLLSGFVDSPDQVKRAVDVAKNVEGVKSVRNSLVIKKDEATGKPSGGESSEQKSGSSTQNE